MKNRTTSAVLAALLAFILTCGCEKEVPVVKAEFIADIGMEVWSADEGGTDDEGWYLNLFSPGKPLVLVEDDGCVYVADKLRVQKFDNSGKVIAEFRPPGPRAEQTDRELYADWFEFERRKYDSPDFTIKWDWERREEDLAREVGDFWELSGVYRLDDEKLLVCKDEGLQPRTPEYFILDRELNLLDSFTVDWPENTARRALRADSTGWMLASWSEFLSHEGGLQGMGVMETWVAPVDEDGKMGERKPLRPDCGLMRLIPGRRMLTLYSSDYLTNEERLTMDWDKLEEKAFAAYDENEVSDYETEWAVLDENQRIEQPIRVSPKNHYKFDYVDESRFGFILSGEGEEKYRDKAILITDHLMQPLCRIELSDKYANGSIWRISIAGDWLAMDWQDSDVDEVVGVKLFKIDWPDDLRP